MPLRLLLLALLFAGLGTRAVSAQAIQTAQSPHSVNTIRNGTGVPANVLGNNGDFYINTSNPTNFIIYGPKTRGVWLAGFPLGGGTGSGSGSGISAAAVNSFGHLIIVLTSGSSFDAGYVIGAAGNNGTNGSNGAPGSNGTNGTNGAPGAAATIAVGGVTTLVFPSVPTVVNVGTPQAAILNFGIPPGAPGAAGTNGASASTIVGSVSTLAPGSIATVTNSGTAQNAVLAFGIPQGASGSGTGTVNAGTAGHGAYYATNSTVVSDTGFPTFNINSTPTAGVGIPAISTTASPYSIAQYFYPTGNAANLATVTGVKTTGDCLQWDASGNAIDAGGPCTTGSFDISGAAAAVQAASLQKSANLSDLGSVTTARTNLGLGTAAVQPTSAFQAPLTFTGSGTLTASSAGAITTNDCAKWDASGNVIDAGAPCGAGGSGVTTPTFTGVAKATTSSATLTAAAFADISPLWTGTADATKYARGDGTWQVPPGSGSSNFSSGTLAARPATCTVGSGIYMYDATDQAAGQQLYSCTATNTWTAVAGVGSSGQLAITAGLIDTTSDVPSRGNANTWTGAQNFTQPITANGCTGCSPAASAVTFTNVGLGSGGTVACTTGFACTAASGTATVTVGTSPVAGIMFRVMYTTPYASLFPPCIGQYDDALGMTTPNMTMSSLQLNSLDVYENTTPLTASSVHRFTWSCGGSISSGGAVGGIIGAPATSQIIQPTADVTGLSVKQSNTTNTADPFNVQDKNGNKTLQVDSTNAVSVYLLNQGVNLSKYPGIVVGAGQSSGVRTSNGTAIQAAITFAETNGYMLSIPTGIYEYSLAGGLLFGNTGHISVLGNGRYVSRLIQFATNTPGVVVGRGTGTYLFGYSIQGISVEYGVSQAGNTSANLFTFQAISQCRFLDINIGDQGRLAGGLAAYRGLWQSTASGAEFQNTWNSIQVVGAQLSLVEIGSPGTGSVYTDMYLSNGFLNAPGAISGYCWDYGTASPGSIETNDVLTRINCEGVAANRMIHTESMRGMTWIGPHFESISMTGASPAIFYSSSAQFNVTDLWADMRCTTVDGTSGTCRVFTQFGGDVINVNQMRLVSQATDSGAVNLPFSILDVAGTSDSPPVFTLLGLKVEDDNAGGIAGKVQMTSDLPIASYQSPSALREFDFNGVLSARKGATVNLPTSFTAYTVYGGEQNATIVVPFNIAATAVVTLGQFLTPSGVGSAVGHPPIGNTCTVRFTNGTATHTLAVVDQQTAATILTATTTANTTYVFEYTATGWVRIT